MRKTKNITVAVSERSYFMARVHAARHNQSLSAMVGFILENLPLLSEAIRNLLAADPDFGSTPSRQPYHRRQGYPPSPKGDYLAVKE